MRTVAHTVREQIPVLLLAIDLPGTKGSIQDERYEDAHGTNSLARSMVSTRACCPERIECEIAQVDDYCAVVEGDGRPLREPGDEDGHARD